MRVLRLNRLDRYLLSEIVGPLALGFLVYTFILLIQFLFRSAEMIIRRGVPAGQVLDLLLYSLPNIVVLTIPMSFLFGILVAVGRMAADSELVAARASGISMFGLYRPVLALSLILAGLNTYLMLVVLPSGNHALQQLRVDIITRSAGKQIEPRVFYEEWEGVVLYVFEKPPGEERWKGVFLAEELSPAESQITLAERGSVELDEERDRLVLRLENAVIHKVDPRSPGKYYLSRLQSLERVLVDRLSGPDQVQITSSKGLREMNLPELRERLQEPNLSSQLRNLTRVEIHKKFSIPAACLTFGLLALALGYGGARGSRSTGFALSVGIIMLYYILLNNGEEAARVGRLEPWLAMWLPNILLSGAALFLLVRRDRDRTLVPAALDRWLRRRSWAAIERSGEERPAPQPAARGEAAPAEADRQAPPGRRSRRLRLGRRRRAAASPGRTHVVLRLPRPRVRFPNLLDRYIARLFGGVLALVLFSGLVIYIVADLTEKVDDVFKNEISGEVIFDYYKYLSLQIVHEIAPVAVLVATLIVFGLLSKTNEVTAAKSLGLSLYRLALPVVAASALVALGTGVLQAQVLPASNQRVAQLKDLIKGRPTARSYRRADRQWLFGQNRYIYNYLLYDSPERTLHRLQVFSFDPDYRLRRRLFAATAAHHEDGWLFRNGWTRSFDGLSVTGFQTFEGPVVDTFPETPEYFESEFKLPDAMRYGELRDYLEEVKASGQAAPELEVELYKKLSFPFISLVMALVALPFSFRLGRRGTLYGVGLGVVLGMVFFGLFAFSSTLGETGALPALLAVWSPSLAFAMFSLYLLLGVRT